MVFTDKEKEQTAVNQAWNRLYQRLEKDGLLPEEALHERFIPQSSSLSPDSRERPISRTTSIFPNPYRLFKWLSVAAVIAGCVFAGWYGLSKTGLPDRAMRVRYNEAQAPTLATLLEDGSVVYLSEQTTLKYPDRFEDNKREVTLQGEAFFEVKKQAERPFIIHTDVAIVEVTGTSFLVKSDRRESFTLTVHEGEVQVRQKSGSQTLTVEAGETVYFDSGQLQLKKSAIDYDAYFECIHFKDEYLADVVTIINMHVDTFLLKVDPAIQQRITFTFKTDNNLLETVEAICLALNLHHSQQGGVITITKE